jgi:ABC-type amino acid transport system permease subunit
MNHAVRSIAIVLACILVMSAAVGAVRWAKRHSTGAQILAGAMILVLGIGIPVINPPQQGIDEAREDKVTKGAEPGDPPTD